MAGGDPHPPRPPQEDVEKHPLAGVTPTSDKLTHPMTTKLTKPLNPTLEEVEKRLMEPYTLIGTHKLSLREGYISKSADWNAYLKKNTASTQPLDCCASNTDCPQVYFRKSIKQKLIEDLNHVLVAKFSHGQPPLPSIMQALKLCNLQGDVHASTFDSKHVFIEFQVFEDYAKTFVKQSWKIVGYPVRFFKWNEKFDPTIESTIFPVWFHLPALPLFLLKREALKTIASAFGRPLFIGDCSIKKKKISYATFCVEFDILKSPPKEVKIGFLEDSYVGNTGRLLDCFKQRVVYNFIPPFCTSCHHLGHKDIVCKRGNGGSNELQRRGKRRDAAEIVGTGNLELQQATLGHELHSFTTGPGVSSGSDSRIDIECMNNKAEELKGKEQLQVDTISQIAVEDSGQQQTLNKEEGKLAFFPETLINTPAPEADRCVSFGILAQNIAIKEHGHTNTTAGSVQIGQDLLQVQAGHTNTAADFGLNDRSAAGFGLLAGVVYAAVTAADAGLETDIDAGADPVEEGAAEGVADPVEVGADSVTAVHMCDAESQGTAQQSTISGQEHGLQEQTYGFVRGMKQLNGMLLNNVVQIVKDTTVTAARLVQVEQQNVTADSGVEEEEQESDVAVSLSNDDAVLASKTVQEVLLEPTTKQTSGTTEANGIEEENMVEQQYVGLGTLEGRLQSRRKHDKAKQGVAHEASETEGWSVQNKGLVCFIPSHSNLQAVNDAPAGDNTERGDNDAWDIIEPGVEQISLHAHEYLNPSKQQVQELTERMNRLRGKEPDRKDVRLPEKDDYAKKEMKTTMAAPKESQADEERQNSRSSNIFAQNSTQMDTSARTGQLVMQVAGAITPRPLSDAATEFTPKWAVLVEELVEGKKLSDPVLVEKDYKGEETLQQVYDRIKNLNKIRKQHRINQNWQDIEDVSDEESEEGELNEKAGSQMLNGEAFLSDGMGDIPRPFKIKSAPNSPNGRNSSYDSSTYLLSSRFS